MNPSSQLKVAFPPILLVVRTMVPLALGSISSHRVSTQVGAAGSQEYLDPQVSRSDPGRVMEGDVKMRGAYSNHFHKHEPRLLFGSIIFYHEAMSTIWIVLSFF